MRCSIQGDKETQSNAGLMQSMVSQIHIRASNVTNNTLTDSQPANFYIVLSTHKNSKMGQYSISPNPPPPSLFSLPVSSNWQKQLQSSIFSLYNRNIKM